MGRPNERNADYFTHEKSMRNDPKVKALRSKFGHVGYAVFVMLLETLTDADGFIFRLDDISLELLAGDFDLNAETVKGIIDYCCRISLLKLEDGNLCSAGHQKRMQPLLEKREKSKERYKLQKEAQNGSFCDRNSQEQTETGISVAESTQSKESKESKVKREKRVQREKQFVPPTLEEFKAYFDENGYTAAAAEKVFKYYEEGDWKDSKGNQVRSWKQKVRGNWFKPEFEKPSTNGIAKKTMVM